MTSTSTRTPYLSIRYKIPILIITPLIAAVGLTGWLAFRSGQQAVDKLAFKLSNEVSDRIQLHVQTYLSRPHLLHQMNAAAIRSGNLNLDDFSELQRYFWNQLQQVESVDTIYFGNPRGEFLGVREQLNNSTRVWVRDQSTALRREIYGLDSQGKRAELIKRDDYDPRERPWYQTAVRLGQASWSSIYPFAEQRIPGITVPGITAVKPIFNQSDQLLGVLGIDVSLVQISEFLNNIDISPAGETFIIDRSGALVASSTLEPAFVETEEGNPKQLQASQSQQPLTQAAAKHLIEKFGSLNQIHSERHWKFKYKNKQQFIQVRLLQDKYGLDWLIVVVVPEADFKGHLYNQARHTLLVGLGITALAAFLGLVTARSITQPIDRLNQAAKDIESQRFDPDSLEEVVSRSDEFGELASVFQEMGKEIDAREESLTGQVNELQAKISQAKKIRQKGAGSQLEHLKSLQQKAKMIRSGKKG